MHRRAEESPFAYLCVPWTSKSICSRFAFDWVLYFRAWQGSEKTQICKRYRHVFLLFLMVAHGCFVVPQSMVAGGGLFVRRYSRLRSTRRKVNICCMQVTISSAHL